MTDEALAAALAAWDLEPCEGRLDHGPDAHLDEARRLLDECRSSHAAGAIPAPGAGPSEGDTTAPDHAPEPLPTGSGAPAPEDRP